MSKLLHDWWWMVPIWRKFIFPTVSNRDLMVAGQSAHLPVVFKLKDCKGPAGYNVKVTLTGTEDSGQPGFLAVDDTSPRRAWG